MDITIEPVTEHAAAEIVGWRYEGEYAFYDMDADENDLADFLSPDGWGVRYFAAHDAEGELVGIFHFLMDDDSNTLNIGLGLRPDLTGQGQGQAFLEAGLRWAQKRFAYGRVTLAVAAFNTRAIRVYERAGFRQTRTFIQQTNGGEWEFIAMERDAITPRLCQCASRG